jgi:hypothetical protein
MGRVIASRARRDPAETLEALALTVPARDTMDRVERDLIAAARDRGATWGTVGHALGMDGPAAASRFKRLGQTRRRARRDDGTAPLAVPPPGDIGEAITDELAELWNDLSEAIDVSIWVTRKTDWSMRCMNIQERIVRLSRLTTPTPWDRVPYTLLLDGVFQRIMSEAGFTVPLPSDADLREMEGWRHRFSKGA